MDENKQKNDTKLQKEIEKRVRAKYNEEIEREKSLLTQASNMQTAFSVVVAAVFMLLPVLIQYKKENADIHYYIISVSLITFFLILSLLFATMAQWRFIREVLPGKEVITKALNEERIKQLIQNENLWVTDSISTYTKIQKSIERLNNIRCKLICASMVCFFAALGLCVFLFLIGLMLFY